MPYVTSVRALGDAMTVHYDDGSQQQAVPTGQGIWLVATDISATPADPGSSAPPASGTLYNPWSGYSITGSWADHMSYSLGGIDWPLGYGTAIKAPGAGTLQSNSTGGLSDWDTGWVGSAGRRSILHLDTPATRTRTALDSGEGSGAMVAIVIQHQSAFGTNGKHYAMGDTCGKSGASANGSDYGGDVHLHVHGLNAGGSRVNFLNFV